MATMRSFSTARRSGAAYAAFVIFAGISIEITPFGAVSDIARSKNATHKSG